jgi:hypothetical protein
VNRAVDGGGSRRAVGAIRHFEDDVRLVVERIPAGTVATYGEVALEAGRAGAARAVGTYLSRGGSGASLVAGGDQHRPAGPGTRAGACQASAVRGCARSQWSGGDEGSAGGRGRIGVPAPMAAATSLRG